MQIIGTLTAHHSRRDRNGNVYWALEYLDHETGERVIGTVSGGESNINAIRLYLTDVDGWDSRIASQTIEHPIREFDRMTRGWDYAGCCPEDLAEYIRAALADRLAGKLAESV